MAKKTPRERDRDSITQLDFIRAFPTDKILIISKIADAVGGEYSNTRARCRVFLKHGYVSSHTLRNGKKGGQKILAYKMTSEKKEELLTRFREYGSLSENATKKPPRKDQKEKRHKLTTDQDIAERDRIYNLMIGVKIED